MLMLSGHELGQALAAAIEKKGVRPIDVAREFGVSPSSITDWKRRGCIDKKHINHLVAYFSDAVPPSHWGLSDREVKTFGMAVDLQDHPAFDGAVDAHLQAVARAEGAQLTTGAKMLALAFDQLDDAVKYAAFEYLNNEIARIRGGKTRLLGGE